MRARAEKEASEMLESVPRPVKVLVLLLVIAGIGYLIYHQVWDIKYGRQMRRDQIRLDAEHRRAELVLRGLVEDGELKVEAWTVRATHVKELEFRDATLTRTEGGKVVEEIKAASMTFPAAAASDAEARAIAALMVRLTKATVTTYDAEGKATTEQKDQMEFWLKQAPPPPGTSDRPPTPLEKLGMA